MYHKASTAPERTYLFTGKSFANGLWGRNLTNKDYTTFYFESMARGFEQRSKPLQFGVDVRHHFKSFQQQKIKVHLPVKCTHLPEGVISFIDSATMGTGTFRFHFAPQFPQLNL